MLRFALLSLRLLLTLNLEVCLLINATLIMNLSTKVEEALGLCLVEKQHK